MGLNDHPAEARPERTGLRRRLPAGRSRSPREWVPAALALLGCSAAACIVGAHLWVRPPAPAPLYVYHGTQRVAFYRVSQTVAVERTLGYRVVEPRWIVRSATGLSLSQLIVAELGGRKSIEYLFGDFHGRWVTVLETAQGVTRYHYDAQAEAVFFSAKGRGIAITTDLAPGTLARIAARLGARPPRASSA